MRAADQWAKIEATLDPDWVEARVAFTPEGSSADAAAVLGPMQPVHVGDELRFHVTRSEGGAERTRNALRHLDRRRLWGQLALIDVATDMAPASATASPAAHPETRTLVDAWDDLVSALPPGWSDLFCELELDSSDHVPRAALLGAPLNPTRVVGAIALRFRVSGKQGYGASPLMTRRCFERMDAEEIAGRLTVVEVLSNTDNAVTQGPVWRVAGRSV